MKTLNDLPIGIIRNAQQYVKNNLKTIGEWKKYWRQFAQDNQISKQDALKIAQDRI